MQRLHMSHFSRCSPLVLKGSPQSDDTELNVTLANDLKEVEQIDRVSVATHDSIESPFEVASKIGDNSSVTLRHRRALVSGKAEDKAAMENSALAASARSTLLDLGP